MPDSFRAIATDIKNGDEIVLKEGSLSEAVRASINLPIVFNPVSLGDKLLIDGSFSNPLPADVVKEMGAEFIIAVDVSSKWIDFPFKQTGWWQVFSLISNVLSAAESLSKHSIDKQYSISNIQQLKKYFEIALQESKRMEDKLSVLKPFIALLTTSRNTGIIRKAGLELENV